VRATLALKHTSGSGGNYDLYLEATTDALYGPTSSGTYYVLEVQNPTFVANGLYNATLALFRRVNGSIVSMGSTNATVRDGSVIRAVYSISNQFAIYVDGVFDLFSYDSSIATGQPGVGVRGVPAGNGISRVDLGPFDSTPPTAVNAQLISTTPFPNRVDIHSAGTVDDPNGTGIAFYQLFRSGAYVGSFPTPNCTDAGVSAVNQLQLPTVRL